MKTTGNENYRDSIAQSPIEFGSLLRILIEGEIKSFLEIGCRWGGSIWQIAHAMPVGSRVVAIDSGAGGGGRGEAALTQLRACIQELKRIGYDAHLIEGDSQSAPVIKRGRDLAPYDAIFIDGDHSYKGVLADWKNYGPLSQIVAFHDVCWKTPPLKPGRLPAVPVECPRLWEELKASGQYLYETLHDPAMNMGIGVIWHEPEWVKNGRLDRR